MADTAYHMEALRRQRVLERKAEASKRIEDAVGQTGNPAEVAKELRQSQLVFSEPGQYARNRNTIRVSNSLDPDHAQHVAKSKLLAKDVSRRHLADKELISRYSLYPPPQNNSRKFIRRNPDAWIKPKPVPDSLKSIQRDQVYHVLHPKK